MDDLDKQLAELQLITNTELQPNPNLQHGSLTKKVGPAVPPKPKKPQPQVPQSYSIKQHQEPSYSSRLQNSTQFYSNLPTLRAGEDAQYANIGQSDNVQYSNVSNIQKKGNVQNMTPMGYAKPSEVMYSNIHLGHGHTRNQDGLIYSNLMHPPRENNLYSNMPSGGAGAVYANGGDELPPPPPPLELSSHIPEYAPVTVNTNFPPPPDELPPPPSPVSSSYSELRRATQSNQDYNNYGMGSQFTQYAPQYTGYESNYGYGPSSQSSSTYESIYEPINPRPQSQMSSRSNYSLYAPYVSGGSHISGTSQSASRVGQAKEQEVDNLTDLLVQRMDNNTNNEDGPDSFGICAKCGEKVVGENSGCTAMDQIFHATCFTCHHCAINLQGKPFYSLESKPYCEEDYLNTLEKCCVCTQPILDRILRATGKPYHPICFCCVICGKSLDGIPFTVDATNQIHCIEDFHKKFAPRCCVCKLPIMPEPGQEETVRVVALDRSFHIQCYKCEDCGLLLSSEAEGRACYPLDDHILCKSCNAKRVQTLTSHMTTEL